MRFEEVLPATLKNKKIRLGDAVFENMVDVWHNCALEGVSDSHDWEIVEEECKHEWKEWEPLAIINKGYTKFCIKCGRPEPFGDKPPKKKIVLWVYYLQKEDGDIYTVIHKQSGLVKVDNLKDKIIGRESKEVEVDG